MERPAVIAHRRLRPRGGPLLSPILSDPSWQQLPSSPTRLRNLFSMTGMRRALRPPISLWSRMCSTAVPSQGCMLALGLGSNAAKARLLSQTCPGAGGRLQCPPPESDLRLGAGPFSWFISHHLGSEELRDFEIAAARKCPNCRLLKPDTPEEDLAQHVRFQCARAGVTHLRHDAITRSQACFMPASSGSSSSCGTPC
jgi:hypothetical protein